MALPYCFDQLNDSLYVIWVCPSGSFHWQPGYLKAHSMQNTSTRLYGKSQEIYTTSLQHDKPSHGCVVSTAPSIAPNMRPEPGPEAVRFEGFLLTLI